MLSGIQRIDEVYLWMVEGFAQNRRPFTLLSSSKYQRAAAAAPGASLGISIDGSTKPNELLGISIDGCKLPFKPCFNKNLLVQLDLFSKLMDAVAPIDLP